MYVWNAPLECQCLCWGEAYTYETLKVDVVLGYVFFSKLCF